MGWPPPPPPPSRVMTRQVMEALREFHPVDIRHAGPGMVGLLVPTAGVVEFAIRVTIVSPFQFLAYRMGSHANWPL